MDAISDVAAARHDQTRREEGGRAAPLGGAGLDPTGRIEELISQNKVMLFIKGTKAFPQCGFGNTVVRLIEDCTDDFETFDVLSDETVREGIKEYSSWPTIPQIYLGGEFIGGADIAIEMHESGELKDAVAEALAKPVEAAKTSRSGISRRTTSRVESWRFSVCKNFVARLLYPSLRGIVRPLADKLVGVGRGAQRVQIAAERAVRRKLVLAARRRRERAPLVRANGGVGRIALELCRVVVDEDGGGRVPDRELAP